MDQRLKKERDGERKIKIMNMKLSYISVFI